MQKGILLPANLFPSPVQNHPQNIVRVSYEFIQDSSVIGGTYTYTHTHTHIFSPFGASKENVLDW